jgi:hypothetical protein
VIWMSLPVRRFKRVPIHFSFSMQQGMLRMVPFLSVCITEDAHDCGEHVAWSRNKP